MQRVTCLPLRNEEQDKSRKNLIKNNGLDVSSKIILSSHYKTTPWFLAQLLYLGCVMVHTRMNTVADTTIPIVQIPYLSTPCGFLQKMLTRLEENFTSSLTSPYPIIQNVLLKILRCILSFLVTIFVTISVISYFGISSALSDFTAWFLVLAE